MRLWPALLAAMLLCPIAHANDQAKVVGTWKLVSFVNEFQDGSEAKGAYGQHPTGYVIFTSEGRVMFMVEAEGRKAPESDEQRAAAFRTIIAYTGSAKLTYGLFSNLGLFAQASYYKYSVPLSVLSSFSFMPQLERRSVSAGVTTWLPLIKPPRVRRNPNDQQAGQQ